MNFDRTKWRSIDRNELMQSIANVSNAEAIRVLSNSKVEVYVFGDNKTRYMSFHFLAKLTDGYMFGYITNNMPSVLHFYSNDEESYLESLIRQAELTDVIE